MPSPYTPPDVIVEQIQRTRTVPRQVPQLPVVVIAPAVQIETRALAGTYEAGEEFQARLPNLTDGATVDSDSLQVLLEAQDTSGLALGTFELALGTDAQLLTDNETLRVVSTLALEYSILSARNNNQVDSLTDDDRAVGTPDGIWLTDEDVDFLGRGAVLDQNTFVIIDSPAAMAGRYRITGFVPSGDRVFTVRLLKVDENNNPELEKDATIDFNNNPTSRFVYGYPTDHFLGTVAGGSNTNNLTTGTIGEGIGVDELLEISSGKTDLDSSDITDLLAPGTIDIPDQTSGDAVWFSPATGGGSDGKDTQAWQDALGVIEVGDWMRFTGDFGAGTNEVRDYKIVAIDLADSEVQLQNSDLGGTGTFTLDSGAGSWPDVDTIEFLRPVKGRQDATDRSGDYVVGTAQGVPFAIEILSVQPGVIELAEDLPALSTSVNTPFQIIRGIPFRNNDVSYDLTRRITDGFSGDILASYQAERSDLALEGLIDIGDQKDIENKLGVIHPDNPIALMADMVTRSGLSTSNKVFFARAVSSDTLSGYQEALDDLETEDVYYLVPASQDKAVIDVFKAHVAAQSQPENKHERVLLASTAIATFDTIIPSSDNVAVPQGTITALNPDRISTSSPSDIDWGSVKPGMVVKVLASQDVDATVVEERRISEVNAASGYATVLSDFSTDLVGTVWFKIDTFPRTRLQQAEEWRDEAKAYGDKRLMLIRPDEVEITYTDKTGVRPRDLDIRVPSYYACAVFAGLASSLPPQQPMTNMPVPGINELFHSNGYFTPDQLNTIAEGGNNILIQPTRNASPQSRHQQTTDVSTIETREFSIVRIVDFVSKFFRNSLRPYIGKHNITSELLTQLRGTCEAILRTLVDDSVLRQGSRLMALFQDPDQPDSIIVEVSLNVPYPVNRIVVRLFF